MSLAGTGEEWVRVVVWKGKKRKGQAVSGDRKEEEGKERGEHYYLAILLQMMVKDLGVRLLMGGQNVHKWGRWIGSSCGRIDGPPTS